MTVRLLIDASNVTAAGPLAIARQLLPEMVRQRVDDAPTVLVAEGSPLEDLLPPGLVERVPRRTGLRNELDRLRHTLVSLPRRLRAGGVDACLTFGDIGPISAPCPHVLFVHQAHLAHSPAELGSLPGRGWLKERYLGAHVGASARRAARIIVQTPVMAERFARRHGLSVSKLAVIPQPAPHDLTGAGAAPDALARCAAPLRLLFLAAYYPHKNHGVLPAVAEEIRRRGLDDTVRIFVTIAPPDWVRGDLAGVRAAAPLVTNLGPLDPQTVGPALRASSALFLPTFLESYGLPYVEALQCGTPVLTSDRDFARWACRDLAAYFDPASARSIVDAIDRLRREGPPADYAARAAARLAELPRDWPAVADAFHRVIDAAAAGR